MRYYVLEQNGRQGVVNSLGQVILPFTFTLVHVLSGYEVNDQGFGRPVGPVVFFGIPATIHTGTKQAEQDTPGYLYGSDGKKLMEDPVVDAYALDENAIGVVRSYREKTPSNGVVSYTGKILVPMEFSAVQPFSGGYVASRTIEGKSDTSKTFTADGTLIATADGRAWTSDNKSLVLTVKDGTKLVNEKLQPTGDARWADLWSIGEDRYVATGLNGGGPSIIDGTGKVLIPPIDGNLSQYAKDKSGEYYAVTYGNGGVGVLDGKGKPIYQSKEYESISYEDGIIVVRKGNIGRAFDLKGKNLLPGEDHVSYWMAQDGLFMAEDTDHPSAGSTFYTADGKKLPVTGVANLHRVAEDRYIAFLIPTEKDNFTSRYGLCDGQGRWLLQPEYEQMEEIADGLLIAGRRDKDGLLHCGLIGTDGQEVLPMKYDSLMNLYDGDLIKARRSTRYGLIDHGGNWVWSASDYSSLVD